MDVREFLARIESHPNYQGQLAHLEILPRREGEFREPTESLPDAIRQLLGSVGIRQLYSHQADAVDCARAGQDAVIVTGTASGKTLCYNLPILETCLADSSARAIYLYPTKALAQDQLRGLLELLSSDQEISDRIRPGVYDGDTPTTQRRRIKSEANLILTNPDMLHASILPHHPKWGHFLSQLKYIVIDEVHTYRGIFGAHVSCLMRRLVRVCEHYGARPLFLAASATIANPGELTSQLIGRDVRVIDNDGAPRGKKYFAIWNPLSAGKDRLARGNPTDDAVWLMGEAIEQGAQALAFTRTRQSAEIVNRYVQDRLRAKSSPFADSMRAYRGGYLPNERREIEQQLFSGQLRGVAATNALELGVDVGSLDMALMVHYPGTIASTWQQAGRAGRKQDESLAVLIASNDPVDQYMSRHPGYFFSQTPEHAVVDPENPYILANHLRAAAFELPLDVEQANRFGGSATDITTVLCEAKQLTEIDGKAYFSGGQNPTQEISLRHISDDTFSIVLVDPRTIPLYCPPHDEQAAGSVTQKLKRSPHPTNKAEVSPAVVLSNQHVARHNKPSAGQIAARGEIADFSWEGVRDPASADRGTSPDSRHDLAENFRVIANVDAISAPELVYPEAVYLHHGDSYLVRELDLSGKVAYVERRETDYYTQAVLESNVRITGSRGTGGWSPLGSEDATANISFGDVDVSWKTVAFKKIKFATRENVGYGTVDIPPQNLITTGFWVVPEKSIIRLLKARGLRASDAMCGFRNLAVVALPLVAMCDSRDVSGVVDSKNLGTATVIIYDRYPGGLGYCEKGFQCFGDILKICHEMVRECDCIDGCPSCVGLPNLRPAIHSDPDLMRGYPMPDKRATEELLGLLLRQGDTLPSQPSHSLESGLSS